MTAFHSNLTGSHSLGAAAPIGIADELGVNSEIELKSSSLKSPSMRRPSTWHKVGVRLLQSLQRGFKEPVSSFVQNPPLNNYVCFTGIMRAPCDHRAILIPTSRTAHNAAVSVSDFSRNLEAFFSPRFKVNDRKFGKLTTLRAASRSDWLALGRMAQTGQKAGGVVHHHHHGA